MRIISTGCFFSGQISENKNGPPSLMVQNAINKILIVTEEPFPIGLAATNRIISLSKGFTENGISVKVLCIRTSERPEHGIINKEPDGIYNGIEFEYTGGTTIRGSTFFKRRWLVIKGATKAFLMLKELNKNDVLILYLSDPIYMILFYIGTRMFGPLYVQDKSEYPFVLHKKSMFGKFYAYLYTSYLYKLFDAVFVMTKPLENYFRSRVKKDAKIFLMPMTVESNRFTNVSAPSPEKSRYIAYCGYLGGNKDGVSTLLRSFEILVKKIPDVKLYIIGDSSDTDDLAKLKELSEKLGLGNRVVFTGQIPRDDIPAYLFHASVLALARPSSLQSEGGFPSKLGEYLSTGNPVVVTRVGDIPKYLMDGVNAFLSDPDDPELFAGRMAYVLSNPEIAKKVGVNGRETALNNFDYNVQSNRLIEFLNSIRK